MIVFNTILISLIIIAITDWLIRKIVNLYRLKKQKKKFKENAKKVIKLLDDLKKYEERLK